MSKKVEEAVTIAVMGIDVVIACACTEDARLACMYTAAELRGMAARGAAGKAAGWTGTIVTSTSGSRA